MALHKNTKNFQRGDIVRFSDDTQLTKAYGEDCLMEVQGYDKENWCRIIYKTPMRDVDIGRENGHPDKSLILVKPRQHFQEELFIV